MVLDQVDVLSVTREMNNWGEEGAHSTFMSYPNMLLDSNVIITRSGAHFARPTPCLATIINPRRTCPRVTVICVCVSVCYHPSGYLFLYKIRYERLLHDMQNKRDVWILLKCSVEKLFAYHSDP